MKKLALFLFIVSLGIQPALAAELERDILGIRLGMAKADAQKRLNEIGKFQRDERKRQEIWELRDERFSHLIVGFDKTETLRYVTAIVREDKDARRLRYDEIGSLETARQAGNVEIKNFNYEWDLAAEKGHPKTLISARGRDAEFLSSLSLKRLGESAAEDAMP